MYGVCFYVDDFLTIGNPTEVSKFRTNIKNTFKLSSDGGVANWYLGMGINQNPGLIKLSQSQYISQKLEEFTVWLHPHEIRTCPIDPDYRKIIDDADDSAEPNFPYREMVGSLLYLQTCSRFDISVAVSVVSQYLTNPKKVHCDMVRRIFYYLRGTKDEVLDYRKTGGDLVLQGWVDASWCNDINYTSRSGYCFTLGSCIISWKSMKQPVVALSSAESEYIGLTPAIQECLWLKKFLKSLGYPQGTVTLFEDNEACIALAKNPQNHKRTKHIQARFHWFKENIDNQEIQIKYRPTQSQLADMFTKGHFGPKLKSARRSLGLMSK